MKKSLLTAFAAFSFALAANAQTVTFDYKASSGTLFDTSFTTKGAFKFAMNTATPSVNVTPTAYAEYQSIFVRFPSQLSLSGKGPNKPIVSLTLSANQQVAVSVVLVDANSRTTDNPIAKQQPSPPNIFVLLAKDSSRAPLPFSYNFTNQFYDNYGNAGNPQGVVDSTKIIGIRISINAGFAKYFYHKGQPDSAYYKVPFGKMLKIGEIKIGDVIIPTGIADLIAENNAVVVSPNPSTGNVNVSFNNATSETATISVVNVIGQEVFTSKTNSSAVNLNLSELDKGVYFVRIQSVQGTATKRLVLN